MTIHVLVGASVFIGVFLMSVIVLVRTVRSEHAEKDWLRGNATILEFRPWQASRGHPPYDSYLLRARLVTADGREADAWAEGHYPKAYQWVGSTRPAWHHPSQIDRFRLSEPRGALIGFLRLLPVVLVLVLVMAVFGGVAFLASR